MTKTSNKLVDFINKNEKEINAIIDNEFGGRVTPRELQQIAKGLMEKEEALTVKTSWYNVNQGIYDVRDLKNMSGLELIVLLNNFPDDSKRKFVEREFEKRNEKTFKWN